MNAWRLGVSGSPPVRGPKARPVRRNIPDWVAAMTMLLVIWNLAGQPRGNRY